MFNTITAFVVAGIISASSATYLLQLEAHSKEVSSQYVQHAEQRFSEYEQLLPGIVQREHY